MQEERPTIIELGHISPRNSLPPISEERRVPLFVWALLVLFLVTLFIAWRLIAAPSEFVQNTVINVRAGWGVSDIARELELRHVVASAKVFRAVVSLGGGDRNIPAGIYRFERPEHVFRIAGHFVGKHGGTTVKITFPEGSTAKQIATIAVQNFPQFDETTFLDLANLDEGFLFPDTYFFYDTATSGEVYETLKENFNKKTEPLQIEAQTLGRSWRDVVILASLIEEEAMTPEDRRLVAGILLRRIELDMYLGVDATFVYTHGKASSEITGDDLRSDDPYNTYRHKGLPPGPITNPGIDAIEAALHPTPSRYLYYLSDKEQAMHYAETFDEHKANKAKYLGN